MWYGFGTDKPNSTKPVESVEVIAQTREMWDLTVEDAHTFFVGDGRNLVHNDCRFQKLSGFTEDVISKGFHVNYFNKKGKQVGELMLTPLRQADGTYAIRVSSFPKNRIDITNRVLGEADDLLRNNPDKVLQRSEAFLNKSRELEHAGRTSEAELWIEIFEGGHDFTVIR